MLVTSCPRRKIRPPSGFISPKVSLRIVLLPEPATPNRALVSPRGRWKDTPFSTTFSSNAMETLSKITASAEESPCCTSRLSMGSVGADMGWLPVPKHRKDELGDEEIDNQNQYRGSDDRLRGRAAHALRTAARRHAVVAADGSDDESEQNRLDQAHEYIPENQRLPGVTPVLARVESKQQVGDRKPPEQPEQIRND